MNNQWIQKTLDAGLYEYGRTAVPLREKWAAALEGAPVERLVVAYNNADSTFASKALFTVGAEDFVKGIAAVCNAFDIKTVDLFLPEALADLAAQVAALPVAGLTITVDKVNVREVGDNALLHHPETLANIGRVESGKEPVVAVIVKKGSEVVTVTVPLDAKVSDMVAAAGMTAGEKDAVVVGGLFGSLTTGQKLNMPIYGYSNNQVEIFTDAFCAVDYAQKTSKYAAENSCGRCTFCREGNYQIAKFLQSAVTGHGKEEDLRWLDTLSKAIADESVCTFGLESVRFLRETLASQAKSYDAHIRGKRCDKGVCQAFTDYAIDGSLCIGCGKCAEVCEAGAIVDQVGDIHRIDAFDCTKCGKCAPVCPEKAIYRVRVGRLIGPTKVTKVGRFRTSRKRY